MQATFMLAAVAALHANCALAELSLVMTEGPAHDDMF